MRASLLALFSVLFAGACAPSADVASSPIINGVRETGYPEVVAVYWSSGATGGGLCSGTVIGPYAILTAKHCVFEETASGYRAVTPAEFQVFVGSDLNSAGGITEVHYVSEVRTTAGSNIDFDVENGTDIAILLLADEITVTPRAVATSGPTPDEMVTIVGFGRTSTTVADSAGTKYRGSMFVDRVGMRQISATGSSWTCQGDSGGPMFDASGAVTGITSYGIGMNCTMSYSVFVRVAGFRTLITDALRYVPPCEPRGETCNGLDDDCDGTADDGIACTEPGQPCATSAECFRGTCESIDGAMVCTRTCFPDNPLDCPAGLYCAVTSCGAGRCVAGTAGAGAPGTTCTSDDDCASQYCAPLRGGNYCGEPCCPAAGVFCGDGTLVCDLVPSSDGRGACIPPELAMGPRPFGSACMDDLDCVSEQCADPGEYCTQQCGPGTACPLGYHCSAALCVAGELAANGGPCSSAEDCRDPGAVCFEGACARPCETADTCPESVACTATTEGSLCAPGGAGLGEACTANEDCRSGICVSSVGCTILCDAISCPEGFACEPAGAVSGCFRPGARNRGGCAVTRGRPREGAILSLALLGLVGLVLLGRRAR